MAATTERTDYGYGPTNGPHTWSVTCHTAAGARQSPININTHKCHFDPTLTPFKVYVSHHGHQSLIRKKHNFQVSFKTDKPTSLEGGPLKNKYKLMQLHFHWGCDDEWGSEHHINGHSYAAELHLVFMSENYTIMNQALNDPEGLCVVGIFLEASKDECPALAPMIAAMKSSKPGCTAPVKEEIDINGLIPNNSRYFTYGGSLTTPPCAECVRWIVCAEPLRLSRDQLAALRSMHCCETCGTNETFRPPVPVGNREVICSFPQKHSATHL